MSLQPLRPADPRLPQKRDFRKVWSGESVSLLGDQVASFTIPTLAIIILHASSLQVGLLNMVSYVAYPLAAVGVGAVVDRVRRRQIMVVSGAARLLLFLSIPLAARLGALTLGQMFAIAAVSGCFAVLYDIALQAYLPTLLPAPQLARGNAAVEFSRSTSRVAGPALGGVLSATVGPANAILLNALSFLAAIAGVVSVRTPEPAVPRPGRNWRDALREGLAFVLTHRLLRPLTLCAAGRNLGITVTRTVLFLYAYRGLALTAGITGVILSAGAATAVLGAFLARPLLSRLGFGRTLLLTVAEGMAWLLAPLALLGHPALALVAIIGVASPWLPVWNALVATARQLLTPAALQGRVHATARSINYGAIPLGSLLGGALAALLTSALGERAGLALAVAAGGLIAAGSGGFLLAPAIRQARQVPQL